MPIRRRSRYKGNMIMLCFVSPVINLLRHGMSPSKIPCHVALVGGGCSRRPDWRIVARHCLVDRYPLLACMDICRAYRRADSPARYRDDMDLAHDTRLHLSKEELTNFESAALEWRQALFYPITFHCSLEADRACTGGLFSSAPSSSEFLSLSRFPCSCDQVN